MAPFRTTRDGITLRFGDPDTPAPEGAVAANPPPRIVVAMRPVDPRAKVSVALRSRDSARSLSLRAARRTKEEQFFEGSFPDLRGGDEAEYSVRVELAIKGATVLLDSATEPGGTRRIELEGGVSKRREPVIAAPAPAQPVIGLFEPRPTPIGAVPIGAAPVGATPPVEKPAGVVSLGGAGAAEKLRISGTIALEHGAAASDVAVRLYQVGFGGVKTLLGEARTDSKGAYEIPYSARGAANVEVHAVGRDGKEVPLSRTLFGAGAETKLDLIAPSKLAPPASEIARLRAAVAPHVGERPEALKGAVERGARRDISLLASATGWDGRALALASLAFEHEATTKVPAEALYALYRAGFPTAPESLARVDRDSVRSALGQAARAGIIDEGDVEPGIRAFAALAGEARMTSKAQGKLGSLADFVARAPVSDVDRAAFTSVLKETEGEGLWERAKVAGVSDQGIAGLKLQGKLAYLTLDNPDLVARVQPMLRSGDVRQLIELDFDRPATWAREISALAGGDDARLGKLIPPAFHGKDNQDRLAVYTEELARRVRQMDPNRVTMRQLARGDLNGLGPAARGGMKTFLDNAAAKDFRLGQTPFSTFVSEHGEASLLPDMPEPARKEALGNVKALHRLYSVSPSDKALDALLALGFKSAQDIAHLTWPEFAGIAGPQIGSIRETQQIYWKARQQSATVINIFTGAKQLGAAPPMNGTSPGGATRDDQLAKAREKLAGRFPTLEALFGSVDYCTCEHCKSVLSPAAYLVDILHFIDPKGPQWSFQKSLWAMRQGDPSKDYDKTYQKPFDALVARRQDIPNIALTCENTNTAMPYIDIVNEILEMLAVGGSTAVQALDTEGASADLIAEPRNITWQPYIGGGGKIGLNQRVYPTTLPLDLPLETVRAFLKQLGLPLFELREIVGRPEALWASAGNADGLADIWLERLGLGPADVAVLTGGHPWYALYGYPDEAAALADLASAKTLSRRLGVSYQELATLLQTGFVNPALDGLAILRKLGVDPHDLDRYVSPPADPKDRLTPAEVSALTARLNALGLTAADLTPLYDDAVRERVLLLRAPAGGCDFGKTTVGFAKAPSNAGVAMALALLKMNVLVRLHRKTGWSVALLDRALQVFVRPSVESLTPATWPDAMRTALIYLAHLHEIAERTGQRVTHEELLTLWAPIPTTGVSSLYERLFLDKAILAQDPVFDHRLGRYLEGSTQLVSQHAGAVTQALGVSHDEIEAILAHSGMSGAKLDLASLSTLMRHAVLARALDIEIGKLLAHLSLSAIAPMAPLASGPIGALADDIPFSRTIAFLDEVEQARASGLGADALEGICRHRGSAVDPDAWADLSDRAIRVLSALPKIEAAPASADPADVKRWEEDRQRGELAIIQALAAELGAPEPLVKTLVANLLTHPGTTTPLLAGGLSVRASPLLPTDASSASYVWFAAAGTYRLSAGTGASVRFGPGDDVRALQGASGIFDLTEVRAGQRYRLEVTGAAAGGLSIGGGAALLAVPVAEHARFSTAIARLRKALDTLAAFGVSAAELDHLRARAAASILDALPLSPVSDDTAAKATFAALAPLFDLAASRARSGGGDRVALALAAARRTYDTSGQQAAFEEALHKALSGLWGFKVDFVRKALTALGIVTVSTASGGAFTLHVPALATGTGLLRTKSAVAALVRLGLPPDEVIQWSKKPIDAAIATKVRAAVKGRYSGAAWRRVAQPIFDELRKKQRDALVAHLTHLPGAPYGETQERLFEHLLLDPGTEPPVLASRIQLAIASVQLFVQRCLMSLEDAVSPGIIDAKRWEWMSRYRVWEVNRKMFLWPENWLDPEFRDDKTHLFRELEGALLSGDVSEDLVRNALHGYLKGLESIARLEMMTMYFEPGVSPDGSVIHVVARTPNAPFKYHYRSCANRMWTPWEPLGVDIEGEHLALTVWRGRMHLFWVTFLEKAKQGPTPKNGNGTEKSLLDMSNETPSAIAAGHTVELQLNWVEQIHGKWVNRSSSQGFVEAAAFENKGAADAAARRKFSIHVEVRANDPERLDDDVLELHVSHETGGIHTFLLFSKLAPPALLAGGSPPTPGPFAGIAPSATKWAGSTPLAVSFTASSVWKDGREIDAKRGPFPILTQRGGYRLLFPSNEIRLDPSQTIPRAAGKPCGYIFAPQGAQHIVYRGVDGGIHDVWWTPNGRFYTAASEAAGAKPASDDPHGYPLDDLHLHAVAYVADDEVLELTWSQLDSLGPDADDEADAAWQVETLYRAPIEKQKPVGRPFGGVFTPRRGVVFRIADGRLLAAVEGASRGVWDLIDLSAWGAPPAESNPTGFVIIQAGTATVESRHIVYRGVDGGIHELRSDDAGKQWSHTDLTVATGAPPAAPAAELSAFATSEGTHHVVYRAPDGVVQELAGKLGTWKHDAIGESMSPASGDPEGFASAFDESRHVVYRGKGKQIHLLSWSPTKLWRESTPTELASRAPAAGGDPAGHTLEQMRSRHIVYRAEDGSLQELRWWDGWSLGELKPKKTFLDPVGPLISPFFYEDQAAPHTFFVEPTLAEKTVHDWEEYVVTKELLVRLTIPYVPTTPWFPPAIPVNLSPFGVIPIKPPPKDPLLRGDVLLKTKKGVFGPGGGVRPIALKAGAEGKGEGLPPVVDTSRGPLDRAGLEALMSEVARRGGVR